MNGRRAVGLVAIGLSLISAIPRSSAAEGVTSVGLEGEAFRRAVEAGFRSAQQPVDSLLCQRPDGGRGLFGVFKPPTVVTRVLVTPVSAQSMAFSKTDHFHRFEGAVFEMHVCLESPKRKEMCIIQPVRRRNGALCMD